MFKLPNQGKSGILFPVLAALLIQIGLLYGCTDDKKTEAAEGPGKKDFSMSCVTLSRNQLQSWVDSGWTKPDNPARIKTLLLQFYSEDASSLSNNMQLTAYPGSSVTDVKLNGNVMLAADTSCKAKTFTGKIILSNNEANLDSLKVFNADGTLKEFDFIRFTPQTFSRNTAYITFKAEVINSKETGAPVSENTRPCPPYCCPPTCIGEE